MARRALWRSGAAKDAVPRIAHLDRDRSLVEDAKRDPARFDALYRRYVARVYSYAYYELGDHHLAEDATEATFVSALTNLEPGGYGLRLVDALAHRWGVDHPNGATRVWFELERANWIPRR